MDKTSQDKKPNLHLGRTLLLSVVIVVAIVIVFQAQLLLPGQSGLTAGQSAIDASSKVVAGQAVQVEPFAALEENCTNCHTERRFMDVHGSMDEIINIHSTMTAKSPAQLSQHDLDRVHGSIQLLKCVVCHDESRLKSMAGMTPAQRTEVVKRMQQKHGSDISEADARGIENAMHNIQGF